MNHYVCSELSTYVMNPVIHPLLVLTSVNKPVQNRYVIWLFSILHYKNMHYWKESSLFSILQKLLN